MRVIKENLTREQLGEEIGIIFEGSSNNNYVSMVTIENKMDDVAVEEGTTTKKEEGTTTAVDAIMA